MTHAIILIEAERSAIATLGSDLAEVEGVREVYSVTGDVDLVAIVRVAGDQDLPGVVPNGIAKVPGVEKTETLIAFEVYSKHDLDRLFSIGFEEG